MICILIPVASARRRDQFLILATVPRQPKSPRSTSFIDSLDTRTDTMHGTTLFTPPPPLHPHPDRQGQRRQTATARSRPKQRAPRQPAYGCSLAALARRRRRPRRTLTACPVGL